MFVCVFVFFFSSRRRHTRWTGDWSSDVCSSDLSDPLADGPTIQRSTQAALDQGMTVPRVLDQIRRAALEIPVVVMTYLNPLMAFGLERFVREAAAAGVSGLILTDFPAGADPELEAMVQASPLALIRLLAP